eukprot:scaffold17180_cov87-Phaeocystis_antarctica.AAC.3
MHQDVLHRVSTPSMLARRPRYSLGMEPRLTPCTYHVLTMHLPCTYHALTMHCLLTAYLLPTYYSLVWKLLFVPRHPKPHCGKDETICRHAPPKTV